MPSFNCCQLLDWLSVFFFIPPPSSSHTHTHTHACTHKHTHTLPSWAEKIKQVLVKSSSGPNESHLSDTSPSSRHTYKLTQSHKPTHWVKIKALSRALSLELSMLDYVCKKLWGDVFGSFFCHIPEEAIRDVNNNLLQHFNIFFN